VTGRPWEIRRALRRPLRKAVKAEPRLAVAWRELGVLAEKGSHWTEARRLYERALAAEPDGADTLFDHARVCLRLGDRAAARRSAEHLMKSHPKYAASAYLKGSLLLAEGDRNGARRSLEEFLAQPAPTVSAST